MAHFVKLSLRSSQIEKLSDRETHIKEYSVYQNGNQSLSYQELILKDKNNNVIQKISTYDEKRIELLIHKYNKDNLLKKTIYYSITSKNGIKGPYMRKKKGPKSLYKYNSIGLRIEETRNYSLWNKDIRKYNYKLEYY